MEEEYLLPEVYQEDLKETGKFTDTQFRDLMNWINDHRFYKLLITINGKDLSSNLPIKITGTILKSSNYRLYRRTLLVLSNSIEYDGEEHKFPYILKIKKSLSEYLINFLRSLGGERLVQDAQLISENIPFLKENLHENLIIYDYHLENNFEPDKGDEVVFLKRDMDEAMKWLERKSRSYNIDTIIDGNIRNKKDMHIILNGFINFTKDTSEHLLVKIEHVYKHPELETKSNDDFSQVRLKDEFNLNTLKFSNQKEHSDIIPNIMYLKLKESTKKLRNLIEVKDLTIAFGDRVVIDHINFNIKEDEIIGIIGESGSGKSITVKSLLGQIDYEGKVNVMGIESNKTNKIAQFIGYVPEDISLIYEDFTPMENLIHFGRQYDLEEEQISRRAKKILKDLEIPQFMDSAVKNLSGGQKKRVSIAISLIHEPELLILDEPTSGLDPMMRFELWKFLDFINKNYNITLIVISHYLDEIEYSDKSAIYLKGIGMHDFDTPSNLKASLPGKGKALEIVLKDINLNILGLLENISDIDEIIQRGKRIRLLADQFSDGIINRLKDIMEKNKIEYLDINKDVVVDMVDYFTVKSRHLGSGKELGNFEKYNIGENNE